MRRLLADRGAPVNAAGAVSPAMSLFAPPPAAASSSSARGAAMNHPHDADAASTADRAAVRAGMAERGAAVREAGAVKTDQTRKA